MNSARQTRAASAAELRALSTEAVRTGRVGYEAGQVMLDGQPVRSGRIARALEDAAITEWLTGAR